MTEKKTPEELGVTTVTKDGESWNHFEPEYDKNRSGGESGKIKEMVKYAIAGRGENVAAFSRLLAGQEGDGKTSYLVTNDGYRSASWSGDEPKIGLVGMDMGDEVEVVINRFTGKDAIGLVAYNEDQLEKAEELIRESPIYRKMRVIFCPLVGSEIDKSKRQSVVKVLDELSIISKEAESPQ